MVDGVVVTTTTSKIIYEDDEQTLKEDHILRYLLKADKIKTCFCLVLNVLL